MDGFAMLAEDCVSKIISLTSPADAASSSVISKAFKRAADSDMVWGAFLPSDLEDITVSGLGTTSSSVNATKKELYLSLCQSPRTLDGGKLSFSLDRKTGKKCYLVAARELIISWGDTPRYWEWTSHPLSRFSEVAKLRSVCWLDIRGRLQTRRLSPGTNYAAYLVFKLAEKHYGLGYANSVIRFPDHENDSDAESRASTLHLALPLGKESGHYGREVTGKVAGERGDGWLEVELGTFYNERGDDGEVEARLIEIKRLYGKSGLIVEGIEFRPR